MGYAALQTGRREWLTRPARAAPLASSLLAFLLALPLNAEGQETGKLSGNVADEATGSPLQGATVVLLETTLGSATGLGGNYFIIGIRPGSYDVRVSFVGYGTKVIEGVLVTSDRTTTLNVTLAQEAVGAEEVVVQAKRPVIDPNQTTSRALITGDEISRLPVASLDDVIARTANSYGWHIRGSHRFETRVVLEGVDISDVFYSTASGPVSWSRGNMNKADQTSPSLFDLDPEGISEVAVNSGAVEPRYTAASGGVVTVGLLEQRGPIRGGITARVAPRISRPGPDSLDFYREHIRTVQAGDGAWDADGDGFISTGEAYFKAKSTLEQLAAEGHTHAAARLRLFTWDFDKYDAGEHPAIDLAGNVGGSLTDNLHFFLTGRYRESHGYMPNQFDASLSAQLKATYELSHRSSVTAVGVLEDRGYFLGQWKNRDYVDGLRFYLEGVAQNEAGSYLGSVRWRHVLKETAILTAQVYRTFDRTRYGYPDDDGDGFTELGEDGDFIDFADPAVIARYIGVPGVQTQHDKMFTSEADLFNSSGVALGTQTYYRTGLPGVFSEDTKVTATGTRLDYANQRTANHFLQLGAGVKFRTIDSEKVLGGDWGLSFSSTYGSPMVEGSCDSEGGSCRNREPYVADRYGRSPWEVHFYASDRLEYAGLIINLGVRVEVHNRDTEIIADHYFPFNQQHVVASEFWGRSIAGNDTLTRNPLGRGDKVPLDVFFNPSIGVSHPIGSNGAMYFSYKRAKQLQPFARLYYRYGGYHARSGTLAFPEPGMDPIISDNYELGGQWEFSKGWGLDINAYMRAVENFRTIWLGARPRIPEGESSIDQFLSYFYSTDYGYADSRGIELVLRRAPFEIAENVRLGLTASYTFSTVEAAEPVDVSSIGVAETFNSEGDLDTAIPFSRAEDLRQVPVNIRGGGLLIESGFDRRHRGVLRGIAALPYRVSLGLNAAIESGFLYQPAIVDNERDRALLTGPTNYTIDMRAEKRFSFDRYAFDLFVDITNLTNRHNVIAYDNGEQETAIRFQEQGIPSYTLVLNNGRPVYGPARQVCFGARVRF